MRSHEAAAARARRAAPVNPGTNGAAAVVPGRERALRGDGSAIRLRPGRGRREPPAFVVTPATRRPGARPLVVVHGITRNARAIADRLADRAAAEGRVLVAPLFAEDAYPAYQRAVARCRADRALLGLIEALVGEGALAPGPVDLAGFSGGAQFAHRFAWLYPHRIGRLTVASAGWWTFPDAAPFPYGLGPATNAFAGAHRWLRANIADFLDREIVVAVGEGDDVRDPHTRSGPLVDAQQGPHRLARAERWADALRAAAERLGLEPRVSLSVLRGCGHEFLDCADAGLDALILPGA